MAIELTTTDAATLSGIRTALDIVSATKAEAQSGTSETVFMSPLRTNEGITQIAKDMTVEEMARVAPLTLIVNADDTVSGYALTEIGSDAYKYSTIKAVIIGNSVTTIGNYAFQYCSGLTSVTIPDSVTTISSDAFSYCSNLASVTIPSSVTSIGNYAFISCANLSSVNCPIPKTVIDAAAGVFINTADPLTIHVLPSDTSWEVGTELTIGGNYNVTVIADLV